MFVIYCMQNMQKKNNSACLKKNRSLIKSTMKDILHFSHFLNRENMHFFKLCIIDFDFVESKIVFFFFFWTMLKLTLFPCFPRVPLSPLGPAGPVGPVSPFSPWSPVYHVYEKISPLLHSYTYWVNYPLFLIFSLFSFFFGCNFSIKNEK